MVLQNEITDKVKSLREFWYKIIWFRKICYCEQ